jgi:DNA polymerase-1
MIGTYIDGDSGLYTCIDVDGRVHPSYLQTGTVTGRLACVDPPAQTWPANPIIKIPLDYDTVKQMMDDKVDLEEQFEWGVKFDEKKDKTTGEIIPIAYQGVHLRDCITEVETRPGYKLLVNDFGQMELRVLCHFAKDEKFLGAFISGYDFHSYNAMNMHNIMNPDDQWTIEQVSGEKRREAKAISFGLAYGKTVNGFAEDFFGKEKDFYDGVNQYTGAPKPRKKYLDKAQAIIDTFFQAYQMTAEWITKTHKYVETYGFIRCITGRKRRLPEIWNEQKGIQNRARRQAVNTKVQGSSADYIKMAMILLEEKLDGTGIELLAQVHDELIVSVPPGLDDLAQELVKYCMENVIPLFCPMVADPHMALRYGSAK